MYFKMKRNYSATTRNVLTLKNCSLTCRLKNFELKNCPCAYSSVGIAIGYGPDGRGLIPAKGQILFSTPKSSDRLLGAM
jgi:hypothetical protein